MKDTKSLSIFIIFLVIGLPFYSASALASEDIRNIKVTGNDNIDNYIQTTDTVKISAEVYRDGDVIQNDEVKLWTNYYNKEFNKGCILIGEGYYKCSNEDQIDGINPAEYGLFVRLYNTVGVEIKNKFKEYYVDAFAPEISITKQPEQIGKNATIEFTVVDRSCLGSGCSGKCSGIKEIKINNKILSGFTGCTYDGKESVLLTTEGLQAITITATDNFDQSKTLTSNEMDVDIAAPTLVANSLIFKRDSTVYNYISGTGGTYDMYATFYDKTDVVNAQANYKNLFSNNKDEFVSASFCNKIEDAYECMWEEVPVKFDSDGPHTVNIPLKAYDKAGSELITSMSYTWIVDGIAPKGLFVGTENCDDVACYVKKGPNKFIAIIEESGSGMDNWYSTDNQIRDYASQQALYEAIERGEIGAAAVFDLSRLVPTYSAARASNCTKMGSNYECSGIADIPNLEHMSVKFIYLNDKTTDDVGNSITGIQQGTIIYDEKAPKIISHTIYASEDSGTRSSYYQSGDLITIEAYVTDDIPIKAYANLSKLIGGDSNLIPGVCEEDGYTTEEVETEIPNTAPPEAEASTPSESYTTTTVKEYKCVWEDVGTLLPYPGNANEIPYELILNDFASNELIIEDEIEILFRENSIDNFWNIDAIDIYPKKIDKQTTPLINYDVYAAVELKSHLTTAKILETTFYDCKGDNDFLVDDPISVYTASNTQIVKFKLIKEDFSNETEQLKFDCNIGIVTQVGNSVFREEMENFSIVIPFYNMPLGTLDENIKKQIEDAKGGTFFKIANKIKFLEKLLDITDKICQLEGILNGIATIWGFATIGTAVFETNPVTALQAHNTRLQNNQFFNYFKKAIHYLNKYCQWGSCGAAETKLNGWYNQASVTDGSLSDKFAQRGFSDVGMYPQNTDDSLILSVAALCPAGIVKNMKKYRQIQCGYIDCLQNQVPLGMPRQACVDQHEYLQCKYVYGEVFQLVPFVHIWQRLARQIKAILKDPVTLLYGGVGYLCNPSQHFFNIPAGVCTVNTMTKSFGKIINAIEGIKNAKQGLSLDLPQGYDACEAVGL